MTWQNALQQFHAYLLLERAMSPNTLEAYLNDVQKLVRFLEIQQLPTGPLAITQTQLEDFILWINQLGLEASSQARMISGLRAFYKFLMVEDWIEDDPTENLEGPRLKRSMPEVLSVYEIQQMLAAIDLSEPLGVRNRAMRFAMNAVASMSGPRA
jgi:integrase/recombinase XerD